MVNALLAEEFADGLHALTIAARAPDSGLYNTGLLIAAAAIAWIFFSLRDYFNQSGNGG